MLKGLLNDKTGKGGAKFMKKKKIKKQFTDQTCQGTTGQRFSSFLTKMQ